MLPCHARQTCAPLPFLRHPTATVGVRCVLGRRPRGKVSVLARRLRHIVLDRHQPRVTADHRNPVEGVHDTAAIPGPPTGNPAESTPKHLLTPDETDRLDLLTGQGRGHVESPGVATRNCHPHGVKPPRPTALPPPSTYCGRDARGATSELHQQSLVAGNPGSDGADTPPRRH